MYRQEGGYVPVAKKTGGDLSRRGFVCDSLPPPVDKILTGE